jgi:hypothetical protein
VAALSVGRRRLPGTSLRVAVLSAALFIAHEPDAVGKTIRWAIPGSRLLIAPAVPGERLAPVARDQISARESGSPPGVWASGCRHLGLSIRRLVARFGGRGRLQSSQRANCEPRTANSDLRTANSELRTANRSFHQISFSPRNLCRTTFVNVALLICRGTFTLPRPSPSATSV